MFVKITFNKEDLRRILAQHAGETLKRNITESEIISFDYELNEATDDVTGISIEFEAPETPE